MEHRDVLIIEIVLSVFAVLALLATSLVLFTANTARRVERALPPAGRFVDINGARIHYVGQGTGPVTLLLVHGLGGNALTFTHSLVAQLAHEFRVIVMERPGSGYSRRAAGAGPIAQAETVAAFIRTLCLDRPVLLGHSLGGAIALATAVAHPSLVPADFTIAGGGMLGMRPSAFVSASTDLMAVSADMPLLVQCYHALSMPIAVLYGTHDRILDPLVHGEALRVLLPHMRREWVEGAGHMLQLTVPDRVGRFVREVVASVRSARVADIVRSDRISAEGTSARSCA